MTYLDYQVLYTYSYTCILSHMPTFLLSIIDDVVTTSLEEVLFLHYLVMTVSVINYNVC